MSIDISLIEIIRVQMITIAAHHVRYPSQEHKNQNIYISPSLLPAMTAINNDHSNYESPYLYITWLTEVTEQSFMALRKSIFLHCSGSKQITEIPQHILVKSRVWGGPQQAEALCHSQVAGT